MNNLFTNLAVLLSGGSFQNFIPNCYTAPFTANSQESSGFAQPKLIHSTVLGGDLYTLPTVLITITTFYIKFIK